MSEALRSQLKWTPTGQNMDNFNIKKDNCSGQKCIKCLQTCDLIMTQKSVAGVWAVYPTVLLRCCISGSLQIARRSVASKHTQCPTLLGSKPYKCHNFRLCIIVTCQNYSFHIWKWQISASILFILFSESSDVAN